MNKIEQLEAEIAGLINSKVRIDEVIGETLAEIEKLKAEQQQWPQDGDLMRRDTIVHELNRKQAIINELTEALKDIIADSRGYKQQSHSVLMHKAEIAISKVENNG